MAEDTELCIDEMKRWDEASNVKILSFKSGLNDVKASLWSSVLHAEGEAVNRIALGLK